MSSRAWLPFLVALSLTCGAGSSGAAEEGGPARAPAGRNVQVTITIGDVEEGAGVVVRKYRMLARDGAPRARMLMGWRTPIPTARAAADGSADAPVTTYVYQNVGLTAQVETRVLEGGHIALDGVIELSAVRAILPGLEVPANMPIIGTFQQELSVVLDAGKPLRVAEVPDPEGGTLYLELTASVLD